MPKILKKAPGELIVPGGGQIGKMTQAEMVPIVGTVSVKDPTGATKETEEVVETLLTDEPLANVGLTLATTINTGNYNSVKIQVSLHYPCPVAQMDETFELVKTWVDDRLGKLVEEVK